MRFALAPVALSVALGFMVAAHARTTVETQQSTAYDVPNGWSVARWSEMTGEAILTNEAGDTLTVERHGLKGAPTSYPNSEKLTAGRTLTWEYVEYRKKEIDASQLYGEIKFADAIVRIAVWRASPPLSSSPVNKETGLVAMRSVAASLKILGPRKCWPPGDCPPGEVKVSK